MMLEVEFLQLFCSSIGAARLPRLLPVLRSLFFIFYRLVCECEDGLSSCPVWVLITLMRAQLSVAAGSAGRSLMLDADIIEAFRRNCRVCPTLTSVGTIPCLRVRCLCWLEVSCDT